MSVKYPYLSDANFLQLFDSLQLKEQFVRIIVLDFYERPLVNIEGHVVSGAITIDGKSSVRRTANITFIANPTQSQLTDINNILSINKKILLEIGFTNVTKFYTQYEKLWFPMGTYLIINPSISNNNNGITISLQLKDKMCMLNGECGGVIPAAVDFASYEFYDKDGQLILDKPTIFQIIQELVHHYGGEQLGKIIIDGLDTKIKQVVKWQGNMPIYLITKTVGKSGFKTQFFSTKIQDIQNKEVTNFIEYNIGDDIGYQLVDFVYPDELAVDAGATVTSVLDMIKDKLGNFEYFYDLNGNFVFQEIRNYLNTTHAETILKDLQEDNAGYLMDISRGKTVYRFTNENLIASYANTPQYGMIKNDFIVWGVRKTLDGLEFPIRYHLAIDKKPKIGKIYKNIYFVTVDGNEFPIVPNKKYENIDFSHYEKTSVEKELIELKNKNPEIFFLMKKKDSNKTSQTVVVHWDSNQQKFVCVDYIKCNIQTNDWRSELFLQGLIRGDQDSSIDTNYYYTELAKEWPKIYDLKATSISTDSNGLITYIGAFRQNSIDKLTSMEYFLDFIDPSATIGSLDIEHIGRRTKVLNDKSVNCIFEPNIPDYILISNQVDKITEKNTKQSVSELRKESLNRGYRYLQISEDIASGLSKGGHFNSAFYAVKSLLYQYTSYNESVTINCLPIFYLEPNTRIYISDFNSGIQGDYVIQSMNIPLDVNGTMSISATKVLDQI